MRFSSFVALSSRKWIQKPLVSASSSESYNCHPQSNSRLDKRSPIWSAYNSKCAPSSSSWFSLSESAMSTPITRSLSIWTWDAWLVPSMNSTSFRRAPSNFWLRWTSYAYRSFAKSSGAASTGFASGRLTRSSLRKQRSRRSATRSSFSSTWWI